MTLRISYPRNAFELGAADRFALLIAGGIGITPILAMTPELARFGKAFAERLRWMAGEGGVMLHMSDEPYPGRIAGD